MYNTVRINWFPCTCTVVYCQFVAVAAVVQIISEPLPCLSFQAD